MIASNAITVTHCEALLKATLPEQRTDILSSEPKKKTLALEQIVKLEKEMNQVQTQYKDAEKYYGSDLLNLVVAKGYLTKLLSNDAVKSYISRHEPEILNHLEIVVSSIIELSKIHDIVAPNPLPCPPPLGEGTEPSPNGGGQGGGETVAYNGNINSMEEVVQQQQTE